MSHDKQGPKSKSDSVRQNLNNQKSYNRGTSQSNASVPFSNANNQMQSSSTSIPNAPVNFGGVGENPIGKNIGNAINNVAPVTPTTTTTNETSGGVNVAAMVSNRMGTQTGKDVSFKEAQSSYPTNYMGNNNASSIGNNGQSQTGATSQLPHAKSNDASYMAQRDTFLKTGLATGTYDPKKDESLVNVGNNTYVESHIYHQTLHNTVNASGNISEATRKEMSALSQEAKSTLQARGVKDITSQYVSERNTFLETGQVNKNGVYRPEMDSSLRNVGNNTYVASAYRDDLLLKTYESRVQNGTLDFHANNPELKEIQNSVNEMCRKVGVTAIYENGDGPLSKKECQEKGYVNIDGHKVKEGPRERDVDARTRTARETSAIKDADKRVSSAREVSSYKEASAKTTTSSEVSANKAYDRKVPTASEILSNKEAGITLKNDAKTRNASETMANKPQASRTVMPPKTREGAKVKEGAKQPSVNDVRKVSNRANGKNESSNSKVVQKKNGSSNGDKKNLSAKISDTATNVVIKFDTKMTAKRQQAMNVDLVKIAEGKRAQKTLRQSAAGVVVAAGAVGHTMGKIADQNTDTAEAMMDSIAEGISNKISKNHHKYVARKNEIRGAKKKVKKAAKQKQKAIVKQKVKEGYKKKDAKKDAKKSVKKERKQALKATKRYGKPKFKIESIGDLFKQLFASVKKTSMSFLLGGLALLICVGFIPIMMISAGGSSVAAIASKFVSKVVSVVDMSWTPIGQLYDNLQEINYAQYIADVTIATLGESLEESAKRDAQSHYSSSSSNKKQLMNANGNPKYDWYCDVQEGQIANVWMREQCDRITKADGTVDSGSGNLLYGKYGHLANNSNIAYTYESDPNNRINITTNANIVPIMSMAHDRFVGEWTYENLIDVQAYVYYMFALSHNTAHYDPSSTDNGAGNTYSFEYAETHDDNTLWDASFDWDKAYDITTGTLTRPTYHIAGAKSGTYDHSACTNIYVHGYNKNDFFGDGAKAVVDSAKTAGRKFLSWLDGYTGTDLADYINQAGVQKLTYDRDPNTGLPISSGYSGYNGRTGIPNIVNGVEYGVCSNSYYKVWSSDPACGLEQHEHDVTCYKRTCNKREEDPHCYHSHSCNYCCSKYGTFHIICDSSRCSHGSWCSGPDNCNWWTSGHRHSNLPENHGDIGKDSITYNGCTFELNCGKKQHKHEGWESYSDPGCYDTAIICKGHCGGHISPTINLAVTYTFEGLAYQDSLAFKDGNAGTHFAAFTDLNHFSEQKTVAKWSQETVSQCRSLFNALPNGPVSALVWAGQEVTGVMLNIHGWWHGLWHNKGEVGSYDVSSGGNTKDGQSNYGDDSNGFEGWFIGKNSTKLNTKLMHELYSLYGTPEDMYADGVDRWADFDVVFKVGYGETLTPTQINDIVTAIKQAGYTIDGDREAVIRDALEHSGMYTYVCDTNAHFNGMYSAAGPSECTGFVSGVYMRALGSKCGFWNDVSSSFTSETGETGQGSGQGSGGISRNYPSNNAYGSKRYQYSQYQYQGNRPMGKMYDTKYPGDIICMSNGNGSGQGHAMIYLGRFTDPSTGEFNDYVVDCSSTMGGSAYRAFPKIDQYPAVYSPFGKTPK